MKTSDFEPLRTVPSPVPPDMHTLTPHLICADAAKAIAFYEKAFGAVVGGRLDSPDGRVLHALLRIGDSALMLNDEAPEQGMRGPRALTGSPVMLHLYVKDADASFRQAVDAGAKIKVPLKDMFWGDRYGLVEDPFGHLWGIATHVRDLSQKEIEEAARTACG